MKKIITLFFMLIVSTVSAQTCKISLYSNNMWPLVKALADHSTNLQSMANATNGMDQLGANIATGQISSSLSAWLHLSDLLRLDSSMVNVSDRKAVNDLAEKQLVVVQQNLGITANTFNGLMIQINNRQSCPR